MFEKDYIMREVQKLVQVLTVILGLKEQKKFDEALDEIDNTYARFFEENRATMQAKSIEELGQLCISDGRFSADLAFALADIIREEAEILEMQDKKEKAIRKYQLVLDLYQLAVDEKDAAMPIDIVTKMEKLQQILKAQK